MQTYFEPIHEAGRALFMRGIKGPLVMLNLLRFREIADYSATPARAMTLAIRSPSNSLILTSTSL